MPRYNDEENTAVLFEDGSTGTLDHYREQLYNRLMIPYPKGFESEEESDAEYARLRREAVDEVINRIEPYRKFANTEIAISDLKQKINSKAGSMIAEQYPDYKQLNLIHRHFIISKKPGPKSDDDKLEMDEATEMRAYIDTIRDISNNLISTLPELPEEALNTYDIEAEWAKEV